ncbi:MAG: F0F1 ATP synthase subunit B [Firmicutes bacterium]|nr:F0F1 ATP synthase subunit B [Bacillota bacterium]
MDGGYVITLDSQFVFSILVQLINTCIMCFVLAKLLYNPVLDFLNARKERIASQLTESQKALNEANTLKMQYELKLEDIEHERSEILESARSAANKNSQQIITQAKEEAEAIKNRALLDIEREREKAKDEVKKQIIQVSAAVSEKFISAKMTDAEQEKLVEDTIRDLEGVTWQN